MMRLSEIIALLKKEQLLKEMTLNNTWHYQLPTHLAEETITDITYDSRDVKRGSLFFCKGLGFKPAFLESAIEQGARVYVSEQVFDDVSEDVLGIIVTDIRKVMSLISMHFFNLPQNELKIIAYTGTKGKTSSAYFCYNVLQKATGNKTALFSTIMTDLGQGDVFKSKLTTEEALPLFKMMRQAVDNGMTHLVMEVSSQAYKQERVYGLTFDVGVFLNISPDHISPIEHPTFDDYFYCKRQLAKNSKQFILNTDSDYSNFIQEVFREDVEKLWTFAEDNETVDVSFTSLSNHECRVSGDLLNISGTYDLSVEGVFNQTNAVSALMACSLVMDKQTQTFKKAIEETVIPGRMEKLMLPSGIPVYVDFAHNYLSLDRLLGHVKEAYPDKKIKVVIGTTGDKGVERRLDVGKVLTKYADTAILTSDDPGTEDPLAIAQVIVDNMVGVPYKINIDRKQAIIETLDEAQRDEVIVVAGKGDDQYQIVGHKKLPYQGDKQIVSEYIQK